MPGRKLDSLQRPYDTISEREVMSLRNEYLLELGTRAAKDATAPLLARASELLKSRYWSKSTWRERKKILKTVEWLLCAHHAQHAKLRDEYTQQNTPQILREGYSR